MEIWKKMWVGAFFWTQCIHCVQCIHCYIYEGLMLSEWRHWWYRFLISTLCDMLFPKTYKGVFNVKTQNAYSRALRSTVTDKGGATIVIGGGTMSPQYSWVRGIGGYKIIRWSTALNELNCGKSNNENWKSSKMRIACLPTTTISS